MQIIKEHVKKSMEHSLDNPKQANFTLNDYLNELDERVYNSEMGYFFYEEESSISIKNLIHDLHKLKKSRASVVNFALKSNRLILDKYKGKDKAGDLFAQYAFFSHKTMRSINNAHFHMLIELKILFFIRARDMIPYNEIQMSFNELINSLNYFSKYEISLLKQFNRFRNKIVHSPADKVFFSMNDDFFDLLIELFNNIQKVHDRISSDFEKKFEEIKLRYEKNEFKLSKNEICHEDN